MPICHFLSIGQARLHGRDNTRIGVQNTHHEVTEDKPVGFLALGNSIAGPRKSRGCNAEQNSSEKIDERLHLEVVP